MTTEMTPERLNEIARQCQAAKAGEGEFPPEEELRAAIDVLRSNRFSAETSKRKKAERKSTLPSDLNDLFN